VSDARGSGEHLRIATALICVVVAQALSGCGSTLIRETGGGPTTLPEWKPFRYASPAPGVPWRMKPDTNDAIVGERQPGVPPALQPFASSLTLPQLLEVALASTPATRQAWEQARSAAAAWGAARGGYYPAASFQATGLVSRGSSTATTPNQGFVTGGGSATRAQAGLADITLSYLLLDFGGRRGRADSAEQALVGANWNHSQVIQDVARNVARAYHVYVGAKAQVVASQATLAETQTNLEAVEVRRASGVATVADLYQAQSNVAQARLTLERDLGEVEIGRGAVATAVGWPANTPLDVAGMEDTPMDVFDRSVDDLIDEAQRQRPDLAAVRAFVRRKEADLRQAESARWPTLSGVASVGTLNVNGTIPPGNDPNYLAGLQIQIPIFQGGALDNAVRSAREDVEAARAALQLQSDVVVSDVWNTYVNVRTAAQQVVSSEALVKSAEQAYEAALARYRAGATNIVELVTVQSTLAGARAQQVRSRTLLFTSYAELVRAIGMLPPGAAPAADSAPMSGADRR
jgi:outer membrane protein TolC